MISFDQFSAVSLVVGHVVSVDVVAGSDKLLCLTVSVGENTPRTILSGIRRYYAPDVLVGKRCVVVSNLEPRVIMGIESNGMLVCVSFVGEDGAERVRVVEVPSDVPIGSRLS